MAVLGFMGGVGLGLSISVVLLNHGRDGWEQAGSFSLWYVIGVVIAGGLIGWLGYLVGRHWYPATAMAPDANVAVMELGDDEVATWSGTVGVFWPFYLLVPIGIAFLFLPGWLKALSVIYVIPAFLFSRLWVVVDREGLRVRLAGGLSVKKIDVGEVALARPIDLEPSQWAGWGYRVVPEGSAVVLRRGDAIEVRMNNDRRFAVTVDDAATGAALLNGLSARLAKS